jgi:uncharacterized membrane-anchored protein
MKVDEDVRRRHEPVEAKVPQTAASFWALKLLTTAMGEAASDYLLGTMSFVGLGLGATGFAFALWVQFRTRRYNAFAYWATVMMVAVFGTMAADTLHHQLGVPYWMSSLVFAVAVAATFWAWYRVEQTLSIHSITTRRREVFYWLTVSFTFALGTALGDLSVSTLHFGFVGSIALFTVVMAVPALGCWRFRLNSVVAFWMAYIVTRPLGASVADWLSKPTKSGGLAFGDGPVAAVLLALALVLITAAATADCSQQVCPFHASGHDIADRDCDDDTTEASPDHRASSVRIRGLLVAIHGVATAHAQRHWSQSN